MSQPWRNRGETGLEPATPGPPDQCSFAGLGSYWEMFSFVENWLEFSCTRKLDMVESAVQKRNPGRHRAAGLPTTGILMKGSLRNGS